MTAPADERAAELAILAETAMGCTACELAAGRTHVVFGDGAANADVMIVGEGPGQREDEQGLPFVGPSGKLLQQLLGEIGLTRPEVYIANVVKCRPPNNRDPRPEEIEACSDYLRTQLRLVDPMVVLTLGNFSSKLLLRTETGISRLRGSAYPWWGRFLVPTYHPAAALRGAGRVLEEMRHDFELVRRVVSGEIAQAEPAAPANPANVADASTAVTAAEPASEAEQMGLFG
jgi:DNA polymerase